MWPPDAALAIIDTSAHVAAALVFAFVAPAYADMEYTAEEIVGRVGVTAELTLLGTGLAVLGALDASLTHFQLVPVLAGLRWMRAELAPADPAYNNLFFNAQGTGGSTAMANSYDQMRKAGATANLGEQ